MLPILKQSHIYKVICRSSAILATVLFIASCAHINQNQSAKNELRNSVVRISTTAQTPYFYSPWIWRPPQKKSGEGIVVAKNLVLTLASLVSNAKLIELTLGSEPVPTQMKVAAINYNANLALLEGNLPENAKPIEIPATSEFRRSGPLNLYWKTSTGMLIEGNAILDRVETRYNFNSYQAISVFKAVKSTHPNIGYGIPVFNENNKFFGLALKGGGEYAFYTITCDTIRRTIDIKNKSLKEPTAIAGFLTKPLTQVYYRKKLGLTADNGGCLVSKVLGQGSGHDQLKEGDVLLSVCGKELDAWGKYTDPVHGKRSFTHLFSEHYISDKFPVVIMRDKQKMDMNLNLSTIDDNRWLIRNNPTKEPISYIVRGGFVFLPLTKTYLKEWGGNFINKAPINLVSTYNDNQYAVKNSDRQEFVILSRVLSHPTNIGLQNLNNMIVDKVNGKPLRNLQEFVDILDDSTEDLLRLTLLPGNIPLLLSKRVLRSADFEVGDHYGIHMLQNLTVDN